MKTLIKLCILLLTTSIIYGQKYSNYHKKIKYGDSIKIDKILDVNVAVIPIPEATPKVEELKTFFDLRDSIPHAFIKAITSKAMTHEQIIDAIKSPLSLPKAKDTSQPKVIDKTDIKVRLIFSNVKEYYNIPYHPNSRLEILNTMISLQDPNLRIKTIDRLENEIDFIDFGSLERNNKITFGANLSGNVGINNTLETTAYDNSEFSNPPSGNSLVASNQTTSSKQGSNSKNTLTSGYGANAGVNYGYENAIKENLAVKLRRLKTGFSIDAKKFTLMQHGVPLNDVHDNAYVTLTMVLPGSIKYDNLSHFDNLFTSDGKPDSLKKVLVTTQGFNYYPCGSIQNLNLKYSAEGLFRQVKKGRGFFENDDVVEYRKLDTIPAKNIEINKFDFCDDVYMVVIPTTNYKLSLEGEGRFCYFRNDMSTVNMIKWLFNAVNSNGHTFFSSRYKMRFSEGSPSDGLLFEDSVDFNTIKTLINQHGLSVEKLKN